MKIKRNWVISIFDYLWGYVITPLINGLEPLIKEYRWAGGRFTGKTVQAINLAIMLHILLPNKKIAFYGCRKKIANKREFFDNIIEWLPDCFMYKSNQQTTTIIHGNLFIKIFGVSEHNVGKIEKLGTARRHFDIQINCFDEAYQFTGADILNLKAGTGQSPTTLNFYLSNPFSRSTPYILDFEAKLPYDLDRMIDEGHYWEIIDGKMYHWSCAAAIWNEGILNEANKELIDTAIDEDPEIGAVVKYGKPMNVAGGIFDTQLKYIKYKDETNIESWQGAEVCIGLDFGYTIDATAAVISLVSKDRTEIFVLDELYINPKINTFDSMNYAVKILNWLIKWHKRLQWGPNQQVICDNDFAMVDTLNQAIHHLKYETKVYNKYIYEEYESYPFSRFIEFIRVSEAYKKDRVAVRVKALLRTISNGKLYLIPKNANKLLNELNLAQWEINKTTGSNKKVMVDANNHCLDALSYSLSPFLTTIGRI